MKPSVAESAPPGLLMVHVVYGLVVAVVCSLLVRPDDPCCAQRSGHEEALCRHHGPTHGPGLQDGLQGARR